MNKASANGIRVHLVMTTNHSGPVFGYAGLDISCSQVCCRVHREFYYYYLHRTLDLCCKSMDRMRASEEEMSHKISPRLLGIIAGLPGTRFG